MAKLIPAAQLYTVRDFIKTPEEIRESLTRIRKMGYTSVQVSGMGKIDPQAFKELIDELGLTVCATHSPFDKMQQDPKSVADYHLLWGCPNVGVGSMPDSYRGSEEGFRAFAKAANEVGKAMQQYGLKFVYHNHNFEFAKFNGKRGFDILMEETDPDCVGFIMDTYWVQAGGCDPVEYIYKLAGRMDVIHFKDYAVDGFTPCFAAVGEGNLNFEKIVKACKDTGVRWAAVEEDVCPRDPFDCLETSLKNINALL